MNFVADEGCDALVVAGLRSDGHDVVYILEVARGAADQTVLKLAADQKRVLLTEDKDFFELVVRLGLPAHGILLLRLNPADSRAKLTRLRYVLRQHGHRLVGSFTVVDEKKTRFRQLRSP